MPTKRKDITESEMSASNDAETENLNVSSTTSGQTSKNIKRNKNATSKDTVAKSSEPEISLNNLKVC